MVPTWIKHARALVMASAVVGISVTQPRAASAAASDYYPVRCATGFTLQQDGDANRFRCRKVTIERVFVTCSVGYLHQALDGKDTCKALNTSNAPNQLRCMTLPVWTVPGSGGWEYEIMKGGDRCNKEKVEYSKPYF